MFKNSKAYSSFSTNDLTKAKDFYGNVLGLKVEENKEMGLLFLHLSGGTQVMIYPKGKDHKAAVYTVLTFPVKDLEKAVDALVKKGIKMEQYKGFEQDKKGISRSLGVAIAWFTDPAGNIIAVMQEQ